MNPHRRDFLVAGVAGSTLAVALAARAAPPQSAAPATSPPAGTGSIPSPIEGDGRHDFDFFFGHWQIANRRLRQRHVGSGAWDTFAATLSCRPLLGGLGHIDEYATDHGDGISGITLRLFDPRTRVWSDQWSKAGDGVLGPAITGHFVDGVGRFEGRDRDGERPILMRNLWSRIESGSVTWEQAFSIDEGASWETNWTMQMSRVAG